MATSQASADAPDAILRRYDRARNRRSVWEDHWRDCYEFAMPQRDGALSLGMPGERKADRLFDGTAPEAVDQLAASLMAELTPPWSRWFNFTPGTDVSEQDSQRLAAPLEEVGATVQSHFDRSNFAVEIHQCYLDLVTAGTACLMFEEAPLGEAAAFRFTAVPLGEAVLEEGPSGMLDVTFRRHDYSREALLARFPKAAHLLDAGSGHVAEDDRRITVVEAVTPDAGGFAYRAVAQPGDGPAAQAADSLAEGRFDVSPFINFRWSKAPGEVYGRSPVMKALPDIKTANKVVELVLKNATIAVTGIWQADDDGVLNPATVKLLPGTIIPKAVGSSGLTPLAAPGSFDVSGLILEDLRSRIRASLLADRLGQVNAPRMTATEILERSAEMERQLGATYGRLQTELLFPLARRAVAILRRRGEIPDIAVDGHDVDLQIVSPIAMHRRHAEAQAALQWFQTLGLLGPDAAQIVKPQQAARWLAKAFRVPESLLRTEQEIEEMTQPDPTAPTQDGAPAVADPMAALAALAGTAAPAQMGAPVTTGADHG